jgi:hypothetical protein
MVYRCNAQTNHALKFVYENDLTGYICLCQSRLSKTFVHLYVTNILNKYTYYYYYYSAPGPVWAGTRAQSGDQYGSGTLHPGQVLRGSLPLLSPLYLILLII